MYNSSVHDRSNGQHLTKGMEGVKSARWLCFGNFMLYGASSVAHRKVGGTGTVWIQRETFKLKML